MSEKDNRPDDDYDPYDPELKGAQRRLVRPRLVDFSEPLPPPDPGPAVPRPYAPYKRLKEEEVVPREDNPLRGWRWMGARLLSRTLWPRDVLTNAVMVYYSGRRAGRTWEDWLGLAPWFMVLLLDALVLSKYGKNYQNIWAYGIASFWLLALFAIFYSSIMAGYHLRRNTRNLPLEEMLMTRLRHVDIVQGLSIRPLAVQMAAITMNCLIHNCIIIATALKFGHTIESFQITGYIFSVGLFRWYFFGVMAETGGALGTRAHLCLRSPIVASLRVVFDTLILIIPIIIVAVFTTFLVNGGLGGALSRPAMIGLTVFLLFFTTLPLSELMFKNTSTEAMDWAHHYPDEWWIANTEENEDLYHRERTLFTPWKPIPGRRKIIVSRAMKSEPRKES